MAYDAIRLIHDQAELRGTAYFELLPGSYRGKCWNDGSVFLTEEAWGYVERVVSELEPTYDHYAFTEVRAETWRLIFAKLRLLRGQVLAAQTVAQLPDEIGFFFKTSRDEFA